MLKRFPEINDNDQYIKWLIHAVPQTHTREDRNRFLSKQLSLRERAGGIFSKLLCACSAPYCSHSINDPDGQWCSDLSKLPCSKAFYLWLPQLGCSVVINSLWCWGDFLFVFDSKRVLNMSNEKQVVCSFNYDHTDCRVSCCETCLTVFCQRPVVSF